MLLIFFTIVAFSTKAATYVVKRGDTLSTIAHRKLGGQIYGPSGGLRRLLELNPEIKSQDFIVPNQVLRISSETIQLSQNSKKAEPSREPTLQSEDVVKKVDEGFLRHSLLELVPFLYYSRIDGEDVNDGSQASLLSKVNYGISARWKQVLSDDFRTFETVGFRFEEYIPDTSASTAVIENSKSGLSNFGIGVEFDYSNRLALQSQLSFSQELYYKGIVSQNGGITLQSIVVPKISMGANYSLWQGKPFHVDFENTLNLILPSQTQSYNTKLGYGVQSDLSITQDFKTFSVRSGLYYRYQKQDSSILHITRQDVGLGVGFVWRFDGRQENEQ